MIGVFFLSLMVGFSGAIVPGPLFALTLKQAILVGWTAGLWLSVGHTLAELTLLVLLRAGLGGLLRRPVTTRIIGLVGGVVLLFFAWTMIAVIFTGSAPIAEAAKSAGPQSIGVLILQGMALSIANPYWYLWWATVGVGLIGAQVAKHGNRSWSVFFIGHSLSDYIWYIAISIVIASSGKLFGPATQSVHRWLIFVSGIGVALLALWFIYRQLADWSRQRQTG